MVPCPAPPSLAALPPPTPPAEDVDRHRRRFNMRMLVPGRPVKETPAAPPPVPVERPTYKEKFIPPELSMWDYFVAKVRSTGHQGSMLFMVLCHGIRSEFMLTSPLTLPPSHSPSCLPQTAVPCTTRTRAERATTTMTMTPSSLTRR